MTVLARGAVMQYLKYVLLSIALVGFIVLGVTNVRESNQKLQLNEIELKSKETQLIELNQKYDEVIDLKTKTQKEKEEQHRKIQELEKQRERLERELQAKLDKKAADKEKLARAAQKASGVGTASAASGSCSDWMAAAGIAQTEATNKLILKESGCNPRAVNPSSGACGIPQAYPCSKLPNGVNTDPVTQLRWMDTYVKGRYGSWDNALSTWYSRCGSRQGCWY